MSNSHNSSLFLLQQQIAVFAESTHLYTYISYLYF